jgi:hypothetical protein
MSIHLIKIIDGIHGVRSIEGGSVRINNLRKELSRLIFNVSRGPNEQKKIANLQIVNTIFPYSDEFQIGYMLHKLYAPLKFNGELDPDFWLDTLGIKVEAKSKLNRKYLGYISDPMIQLDKTICLKLLSKDVFEAGRLENAFEHQGTDIAIMNLSHSQFGSLFASYAFGLDNLNFELSEALGEAIYTVRSKDKAVILYSEQISMEQPYSICAIVSTKSKVEDYGSRLDKVEKAEKIDTRRTEGYYRLIDGARKLN